MGNQVAFSTGLPPFSQGGPSVRRAFGQGGPTGTTTNTANTTNTTNTDPTLKPRPLSHILDYIATHYILTSDFASLRKLYEKEYCDKLVILTAGPSVAQKPLPPPTDKPAEQPAGPPEH